MNAVLRTLRVAGYIVLAIIAFMLSFFVGRKKAEVSMGSFVSSPYTYADAPYAEGGYYSCGGGGDGSGGGGGSCGSGGSGSSGSGCGSTGG